MGKHHRRGSVLLTTMIILMVLSSLGAALLSLTSASLFRSQKDTLRAQALDAAEAGAEKAIYYVRGTAPDGTVNGSWRTAGRTESLAAGTGNYTISVGDGTGDDTGKIVIVSTGTSTNGTRSVTRRLRVVFTRNEENISPWNNVIFAGVGQTGQSIQGNVVMRGSVHLLGDGEPYTDTDGDGRWDDNEPYTDTNHNGHYDIGEPYTDTDGDGHRDSQEPFVDMNGNGSWDPPLTVTDLADDINGTADIGNNYSGMTSGMLGRIPSCPTVSYGGETVQSLSAKLRVKHGLVSISGTAEVGAPNVTGGSPAVKEKMNGCFVNDGWSGTDGASHAYADNGTSKHYDLGDVMHFPDVLTPVTVGGVNYSSHMAYLQDEGLNITGPLNLQPDQTYAAADLYGNSITINGATHTMTISGIVYVNGDINLNRGSGSGNDTFTYTGRGTLASSGSVYVHTNILSAGTFPTTDVMGMVARHHLELATGPGDSQLEMQGAFYAQEQVVSQKQNEITGTFVSSYYAMQNVPHMYQVPALANNLPPGLPGSTPIWVVTTQVNSWKEI
jgi:hypothetical protein